LEDLVLGVLLFHVREVGVQAEVHDCGSLLDCLL
jgi:hypothetical protein